MTGVLRREPAIDFQSAQELLTEAMEDPEVVAAAARQGRIVVSHDVNTMPEHFWRFLATHRHSPGLFLLPQTIPVAQAIEELVLIWAVSDAAEWEDRLLWLPL